MPRSFNYVVLSGDRWAVRLEERHLVELFGRESQAVRSAIGAAEVIWAESGLPTVVRVQLPNGTREQDRFYGEPIPGADE